MQKTRNRSGRKGGYHGYTLSQAERFLTGKEKIIDEPYVSIPSLLPKVGKIKRGSPKTFKDVLANKEEYISKRLKSPLKRKGIIS